MIVDKFLKEQKILRLTTISPDGTPHIVPVWYMYTTKIYIGTNTKTIKVRNLQKNKKIAFCVDTGIHAPDIYGVMGQGQARLILDKEEVRKIATKILAKYSKSVTNKAAQELLNDTDCIIEISPDKIIKWNY